MGWKDTDTEGEGKYIKFKAGMAIQVKILDYPTQRDFEGDDGGTVESYDLPVLFNGEEKIIGLSSKRLRRALAAMDDMRPMVGTWCAIKATGEGFQRHYQVVPLLSAPEGQEDKDEEGINAMEERLQKEEEEALYQEEKTKQAMQEATEKKREARQARAKAAKETEPDEKESEAKDEIAERAEQAASRKRAVAAQRARERRARIKAAKETEEEEDT